MRRSGKAVVLLGLLVAGLATISPGLKASETGKSVREGEAVVTELGPNASAVTY